MEGVDLNIQSEGGHINKGYANWTIFFSITSFVSMFFHLGLFVCFAISVFFDDSVCFSDPL